MSNARIDAILAHLTAGAAPGHTRHVLIDRDIATRAVARLSELAPIPHARIVCDAHTLEAAARSIEAALRAHGWTVDRCVVEPAADHDAVVCDDATIERVEESLRAARDGYPIAVGAGTITDIVKMAATRLGRGFSAYATAASMNGYTSAIAAVLSRGVKRTLPTRQADAVFADIDVIARAPAHLNQAGFGDLLSKPFSTADWLLSHLVRGVPFDPGPARLLDEAYDALLDQADGVASGSIEAIATLTRTIVLSGFTMALAGSSAPASGGEHLVSHYWDMEQHCRDLPLHGLHGAQVGVATRISAMLFERLIAIEPADIDPAALAMRRPDTAWLDRIAERHPRLTEPIIAEVREQIAQKQRSGAALRAELEDVRDRWPAIREALAAALLPADRIGDALRRAGGADRPSALGVAREHAVHSVRVCRDIRGRYVALDLIDDLGRLDAWAEAAVAACEG